MTRTDANHHWTRDGPQTSVICIGFPFRLFITAFFRLTITLVLFPAWMGAWRGVAAQSETPVTPGVEVLVDAFAARLEGKRVAILTNPSGVDRAMVSTIDRVRELPRINVIRLFAPEHGLRGGLAAGEMVKGGKDPVSGLPVVSLHGASRRPSRDDLKDLDIVLYDIQDVGHRTYTFVSSLTYLMEACEEAGVAVWVLDRPEPMGGKHFGGPMLDKANVSFIGVHDVPQVYGMTPGEWARLIQRERTPRLELSVVPMRGWRRGMTYGELGWVWVPPSEHIPRWESSFFYAMTGTLGELGVVSEGVGTPLPFEQIGAPWIDARQLARALNRPALDGVKFRPTTFRPRYGAYQDKTCFGVQIHLTHPKTCQPYRVSDLILTTLARDYAGRELFKPGSNDRYRMFLKAVGDGMFANALSSDDGFETYRGRARARLEDYARRRQAVLIYE